MNFFTKLDWMTGFFFNVAEEEEEAVKVRSFSFSSAGSLSQDHFKDSAFQLLLLFELSIISSFLWSSLFLSDFQLPQRSLFWPIHSIFNQNQPQKSIKNPKVS